MSKFFKKIINWFKNLFISKPEDKFEFEKIHNTLIIHIPRYNLPPHQYEPYMKAVFERFNKIKNDLGVTQIVVLPK